MPSLSYGTGAYQRDTGNLPPLRLINMFVEKARTSENQIALQSRMGLSVSFTRGTGPIDAEIAGQGNFAGSLFTVSGSTLYKDGTAITGTIAGSGRASIAISDTEVAIVRGGTAYSYNGTDLAAIAFPDSADVKSVCFINGRFVFIRDDTQQFYWSDILDARTVGALAFASAERQPDRLLDCLARGDTLLLLGTETCELWNNDGSSADLPFSRIEQVVFDVGIIGTGAVTAADNSIYWIGSDAVLYRMGETPQRVSDHWLEEKIAASVSWALFTIKWQGHVWIVIRLDTSTYVHDVGTQEFWEAQTNGGQWSVNCSATVGTTTYLGSDTDGSVFTFSGWDDDGVELERRFTAALQLDQPLSVDNVRLWANVGQSAVLSGSGSAPVVEMRSSRDAGETWTDFDDAGLGNAALGGTGAYRTVPEWRRLGMFDFPGLIAEFRVTDPVPFRVSAVKANEPLGGRSRG